MLKDRARKALTRKARKGFVGYPVATIAFYGPTDDKATKLVAGMFMHENAEARPMRKWFSDKDLRRDPLILEEVLRFVRKHNTRSVTMVDRIIGCPHEEGVDYPEGGDCPHCPFWAGSDRWTDLK